MHRKWKSVAALGMAVLLGCLVPVNTMLAAEEDTEAVQEMEADSVSDDEAISDDDESVDEEENADDETGVDEETADDESAEDENAGDEADAEDENVDDEADTEDENVIDEADTDIEGSADAAAMSAAEEPEAGGIEVQASTAAPVISIKWNGQKCIYDLGGKIDYKYVKDPDQKLELSATQDNNPVTFYYYIDNNPGPTAMEADQVNWSGAVSSLSTVAEMLSSNKTYVVYVKAESDGQTVYARSCGIVVDTEAPKVTGVTDGGTCSEGTIFHVEDPNLESVKVNGKSLTLASDGNYQVTAYGTSCEIKAKDKAGNETVCKVNVSGGRELATGDVITVNGTYSLKAGVPYKLSAGEWRIAGDSTIYKGGNTFYVMISDNYKFTKR